jgi:hypothetical protein
MCVHYASLRALIVWEGPISTFVRATTTGQYLSTRKNLKGHFGGGGGKGGGRGGGVHVLT